MTGLHIDILLELPLAEAQLLVRDRHMLVELLPDLCQGDAALSAVHELTAELCLEAVHRAAHVRLIRAEHACRLGEAATAADIIEDTIIII